MDDRWFRLGDRGRYHAHSMTHIQQYFLLLAPVLFFTGCGDSPFYYTPLPSGLEHVSNGGELGWIGEPTGSDSWTPIYPVETDWYCNDFAVIGDNVVGLEIVYAERAFVEPPVKKRWFCLDTANNKAVTFDSLQELKDHCATIGHTEIPTLGPRTKQTSRYSRM